MTTISEIDSDHVEVTRSNGNFRRIFKPAQFSRYGEALKSMKTLLDSIGYENLTLQEKQIVGRWNLIEDQDEIDRLFTSIEQQDITGFQEQYKVSLQFSIQADSTLAVYRHLGGVIYNGDLHFKILSISVDSNASVAGTVYDCRIYDRTNRMVIAEKTGLTNTETQVIDLGEVRYYPTVNSVFSVQVRRTSGTGIIECNSVSMEVV